MDLNLKNLDADTRSFFEQAYATFRERTTCDEAVRNREPFVGPGRNITKKTVPEMTPALAFEKAILCKARVARNENPAKADHIQQVWDNYYALRYRHVSAEYPFPAEELAALNLSILKIHDVFNDVKLYKSAGPRPRPRCSPMYPSRPKSVGEILTDLKSEADEPAGHAPYNLVLDTARTFAGKIKKDKENLEEALNYLERAGYRVKKSNHAELRKMQMQEINARMYPKTYL